ncbi:UDP-N-acetylmuramate dehydrogenase [Brevundimonas aveniformis]|uniref:UDP-N-acetylmuramate dehydrogenase n=1 Tax=Brevundimonas aveniformis TaxID=370977 RepID=UPI002491459C|nr:UDP-N-acetylmuramate dehydrogenase [Brevundimonas aveniformis]
MASFDNLPAVRGKLLLNEPLGPYTWFRVGGAADALFIPADAEDLADFLKVLDPAVPVTVLGVGSNVIVRDGGVEGVVIRLAGRTWAQVTAEGDTITAGAGALDSMVAKASAKAGIGGLEFYAGIPGTVGGALTMNAGCYGAETKDILISAWGLTRTGERVDYALADFGYTYRHSVVPENEIIWIEATYRGAPADPLEVQAKIDEITSRREQTQPIREKTGGSTFKNPPGHSSWKLVDDAGWRGKLYQAPAPHGGGGARFSELHSNFMINPGEATAADIEGLGDTVRADVLAKTGVQLDWEIKRIGRPG